MNNTNNNYCVILAGGKGRRLWPCSRESKPKQFIDFFGSGRTQLQQTYDRFKEIVPVENIYVNTNDAYIDLVLEQLPDLAPDHLLAEPIHRGTAPSVASLRTTPTPTSSSRPPTRPSSARRRSPSA